LRLTVASGVPSLRAAAERLPASTTTSRIDIASSRFIEVSEIWKDGSQFWRLLCFFERATFAGVQLAGPKPWKENTYVAHPNAGHN
jgi:hypothetical protein